jgi:hypothetical protein
MRVGHGQQARHEHQYKSREALRITVQTWAVPKLPLCAFKLGAVTKTLGENKCRIARTFRAADCIQA